MTLDDGRDRGGRADREAVEWLAKLRGSGSADQQAFEDWYSAKPANGDAYERLLGSWRAMGELADASAQITRPDRRWSYALAAMAVVLLVCVGIGGVLQQWRSADVKVFALTTRIGELRTASLPDGSHVTLDTQSAIRGRFDSTRRQVRLLRGRARFDVAREPRPFVIATGSGSVSTSASILDVAYYDKTTMVGVVSGTAEAQPTLHNGAIVRIASGSSLLLSRDRPVGRTLRYTAPERRWTAGMLAFEDVPVSTVIAAANLYSERKIVLADPALAALRFTGTFKANDTVGLAHMIAAMFGLRCDETGARDLVLSKPAR